MSPSSFFPLFTSWQCNLPKWWVPRSCLWLRCPDDVFEQLCAITSSLRKEASPKHAAVPRDSIHCFSLHNENWDGKLQMPQSHLSWGWCQVKDTSSRKAAELESKCNPAHMKASSVSLHLLLLTYKIFSAHMRGVVLRSKAVFIFCPIDLHKVILPRQTPGTTLSPGDKWPERLHRLRKQTAWVLC